MALEKECDLVLAYIHKRYMEDADSMIYGVSHEDIANNPGRYIEDYLNNFIVIISILMNDGNVIMVNRQESNSAYKVTTKGLSFIANGTYTKRKEAHDLLLNLTISNGKIQSNLLHINRWIAFAGIVAALYYIIQIVDYFSNLISKHYPLYYKYSVTFYLLLLGGLIGVSTTIIFLQLREAKKRP